MAIKAGDLLFVDTNVLLTATDESRPHYRPAQRLLVLANSAGFHLGVSGQVLREYLVVATRPIEVNGLGLNPDDALNNVDAFRERLVFYEETEAVATRLRQLTRRHGVTGKRIHDANVVATMLTHGVSRLITENPADFASFPEIDTVRLTDAVRGLPHQE